MLIDEAIVYPIVIPIKFMYCIIPHATMCVSPLLKKKKEKLNIVQRNIDCDQHNIMHLILYVFVYIHTKKGANCMHVSGVSLAIDRVAGAIAISEQTRGIVTYESKQYHH